MQFELNSELIGKITKRQTTYCLFQPQNSQFQVKANYIGKIEHFIEEGYFSGAAIKSNHPLLEQHHFTETSLFINSKTNNVNAVCQQLLDSISHCYSGWRRSIYFNNEYGLSQLLAGGSGLLYQGPPEGASAVIEVLNQHDIQFSTPYVGVATDNKYKVLLLGKYFVVAENFTTEVIS